MELYRLEIYLLEHEKLDKHEGCEVKVKSLALKSKHDSDQEEESGYEDEEDDALIKCFENILRKENTKEIIQRET